MSTGPTVTPPTTVITRLGRVCGIFGNIAAVLILIGGFAVAFTSLDRNIYAHLFIIGCAAVAYLFGRALRYILAGT